jgi:hypothetical protein
VIWYIGLPAVLLGAAGLAALARQSVSTLLTWTDPGAEARSWLLALLIALWAMVTVLWRPAFPPNNPGPPAAWSPSCCPA